MSWTMEATAMGTFHPAQVDDRVASLRGLHMKSSIKWVRQDSFDTGTKL